jgi:cytochrome c oxidase cbb3-type subunit III
MPLAFWVAITILSSSAVLIAQNEEKPVSPDVGRVRGPQLFAAHCSSCHGLDGRGSQRAPDIANNAKLQKASDSEIVKILREGVSGTGMPAFRSLGNANIHALVVQLRALQGVDSHSPLPGSPGAGKSLFFGKAACSTCHMVSGAGGFLGSDLSTYARGKSAAAIREALTNPISDRAKAVVITTEDGTRFDGLVRNEDNFSLQLLTADGSFHFFEKSNLRQIEHRPEPLMPTDYASRFSPEELSDIVSYLIQLGRSTTQPDDNNGRKPREWEE